MNPATDRMQFEMAPAGRYVGGDQWMHFCVDEQLFGVLLWGNPDAGAMQLLRNSLEIELGEHIAPHQSLVDASRLESADSGAFETLGRYVVEQHHALGQKVTRLALVRPAGLVGAIAAGFYQVLEAPYPVELFASAKEGLDWLGRTDAVSLTQTLDRLFAEHTQSDPVITGLRTYVAGNLLAPDLAEVARLQGLSVRTLQRRLAGLGSSFQAEVTATRIAQAKRRMIDSSAALTTIALDVGFTSPQHFSKQFREAEGLSPSDWRKRMGSDG